MRSRASAILVAAAVLTVGCHVTESLRDCRQDRDCPLGERCHPRGEFCEPDPGPIVVGASLPLSGDLGDFGQDIETALELAELHINSAGGVLGRELRFTVLDDETSVERARQNVRTLIERRVAGIIGPLTSEQVLASEELSFRSQVLQITPTAGTPKLSMAQPAMDRYTFRTISTVRRGSAAAIALFTYNRPDGGPQCREMAILHTNDAIGTAYRNAVEELFEKQGGCVTATADFPTGELVEYDRQVSTLMEADPDCATLVAFPEAGAEIVGEYERRTGSGSDLLWMGTTSLHGSAFLDASRLHPQRPAQGVYGGDEDTTPITRQYRELRELYNDHYDRKSDKELPVFVSNTYDAAMLMALAIVHAGTIADRERIRDGLWAVSGTGPEHTAYGPIDFGEAVAALERGEKIHYKGASSRLVFDDRGTVSNPTVIWKVDGNDFVDVHRYSEQEVDQLNAADDTPAPDCSD